MQNRILILPVSALIIIGLCAYKMTRKEEPADATNYVLTRRAPVFELFDHRKPPQLTRMTSFLGRHHLVMVFFDPKTKLEDNPTLSWLIQHVDSLDDQNVKIIAVSPALPQTHRKMLAEVLGEDHIAPLRFLSDLDGSVHRDYGLDLNQLAKEQVFLIDRAGNLTWNLEHPIPLSDPLAELQEQFSVE